MNGEMEVFTPKDEVKYLPQGATVLDFAYHIHSDVGNHCAGAVVNGTHAELHKTLQAGDTIEIFKQREYNSTVGLVRLCTNATGNQSHQAMAGTTRTRRHDRTWTHVTEQ